LKLTTPAHKDSVFLTILTTFGYPGLQVEHEGVFKSVKPVKDSLVINLGETLSRATNFKLKATNHRVLDIGIERYSSPFFLEPAYSTVVPANLLDDSEEAKENDITYGVWLINKISTAYAEWKDFKPAKKQAAK
jgi:isopenicillin N synthase-like dioxygenase